MSNLFKAIDVWRRLDGRTVRYRCFQVIPGGGFCVQSADFYRLPIDAQQAHRLDEQFVDLLIGQAPDQRDLTFPSLEEAIAHHDQEFTDVARGNAP